MKKYFIVVIINYSIIFLSLLTTVTYGGFSLICNFECDDLPYRPVCAKNIYGHTKLLRHKCFFKELMCNDPRAYWRFTKKSCYQRPPPTHYLPPNSYLPPYPYVAPPYLPPTQNLTPLPCSKLNEISYRSGRKL